MFLLLFGITLFYLFVTLLYHITQNFLLCHVRTYCRNTLKLIEEQERAQVNHSNLLAQEMKTGINFFSQFWKSEILTQALKAVFNEKR